MKLGYLIPEFPGQTHTWIWREITHLRDAGVEIEIFSTRPPSERDRARHAFAESAREETTYLWPTAFPVWFTAVLWVAVTRPLEFLRCVQMAMRLPITNRPAWKSLLPLLPPACVLAQELNRRKIIHLHIHSCANSAILGMMVKRLTMIGYSLTLNANIEWWGGAMAEKLGEAHFIIVVADWLLKQVKRDYPNLHPDQAVLARTAVDTRKWVPSPRQHAPDDPFRIITVGRLHQSKGHQELIRAMASLLTEGRKVELCLLGDGPQRHELQTLAEQLGIAAHVRFEGSVSEDRVIAEMYKADAFVLASHSEPLGVAYMEAMALELATIGTASGGAPEIIAHNVNGLLVEPTNVKEIAAAIAVLQDDPVFREKLAKAGRQRIVAQFDSRLGAETLRKRLETQLGSRAKLRAE